MICLLMFDADDDRLTAGSHDCPRWTDGYQAIAAEIVRELPGCRSLVFPVGGGGLLMGLLAYLRNHPAPLRLFGCEPFWVPFTVHRTTPPAREPKASRFDFIHADGFYNEGLTFLICWVPLAQIDADVGGLAVVEGVHKQPSLHRREGLKIKPIDAADVPAGAWRRTTYRPGDVLLMSLDTPHTGITNHSDRFRLSMDTRVMPSSGNVPIVGRLTEVGTEQLRVRDTRGEHVVRLDDKSFVRGMLGDQMTRADIPARFAPGDAVIIAVEHDHVINMRPQH